MGERVSIKLIETEFGRLSLRRHPAVFAGGSEEVLFRNTTFLDYEGNSLDASTDGLQGPVSGPLAIVIGPRASLVASSGGQTQGWSETANAVSKRPRHGEAQQFRDALARGLPEARRHISAALMREGANGTYFASVAGGCADEPASVSSCDELKRLVESGVDCMFLVERDITCDAPIIIAAGQFVQVEGRGDGTVANPAISVGRFSSAAAGGADISLFVVEHGGKLRLESLRFEMTPSHGSFVRGVYNKGTLTVASCLWAGPGVSTNGAQVSEGAAVSGCLALRRYEV